MGDGQFNPLSLKTLPTWGTLLGMRGGGSTWQPIGFGTSDSDDYGQGAEDGLFAGGSTSYGTRSTSGTSGNEYLPYYGSSQPRFDNDPVYRGPDPSNIKPGSAEMPYESQGQVAFHQPIDGTDLNRVVYANGRAGATDGNGNPVHPVHVADAVANLSQTNGASLPGGPNARYGDDYSKLTPKSSYLDLMNSKQVASSQPIGDTGLHHVVYSTGDAAVHDTDGNPKSPSQVASIIRSKRSIVAGGSPVVESHSELSHDPDVLFSDAHVKATRPVPSSSKPKTNGNAALQVPDQPYIDNYEVRTVNGKNKALVDAYSLDVPPGVSVDANIENGQRMMKRLSNAGGYDLEKGTVNALVFYFQVRNRGPMDYKQHGPFEREGNFTMGRDAYENFGNFNYGAYGAARGFTEQELLVAAGRAQQMAGTSRPEWKATYGDDPIDQMWIKRGYAYALTKMGKDHAHAIRHYYRTR